MSNLLSYTCKIRVKSIPDKVYTASLQYGTAIRQAEIPFLLKRRLSFAKGSKRSRRKQEPAPLYNLEKEKRNLKRDSFFLSGEGGI